MVAEPFSVDAAVVAYRLFVIAYAATIPGYFYYRWAHTVQWDAEWTCAYQVLTCALEMYGALNVLLLGLIRFRCPWAPACPKPPELTSAGVGHWREDEPLAATPEGAARCGELSTCSATARRTPLTTLGSTTSVSRSSVLGEHGLSTDMQRAPPPCTVK